MVCFLAFPCDQSFDGEDRGDVSPEAHRPVKCWSQLPSAGQSQWRALFPTRVRRCHPGRVKLAMGGAFTPRTLTNALNQGFLPGERVARWPAYHGRSLESGRQGKPCGGDAVRAEPARTGGRRTEGRVLPSPGLFYRLFRSNTRGSKSTWSVLERKQAVSGRGGCWGQEGDSSWRLEPVPGSSNPALGPRGNGLEFILHSPGGLWPFACWGGT